MSVVCEKIFTKTAYLLIIFGNRKRWNSGIVNECIIILGIGRTGTVFHFREWNSWNCGDRF